MLPRFNLLKRCLHYKPYNPSIAASAPLHLYSKGVGVFGALGLGDSLNDVDTFKRVNITVPTADVNVKKISAGWGHSACILQDGGLIIFGRPYDFSNLMQIHKLNAVNKGLGRFVGRFTNWFGDSQSDEGLYTTPLLVPEVGDFVDVSCSAGLTLLLNKHGQLYSFGLNRWGQCGIQQKGPGTHIFEPTLITGGLPSLDDQDKIIGIDTGLQHCVAFSQQGKLFTWGKGNRGQLGKGDFESTHVPTEIEIKTSTKESDPDDISDSDDGNRNQDSNAVVQAKAGFGHTAALLRSGEVYIWGKGMSTVAKKEQGSQSSFGQIIVYEDQAEPRIVVFPTSIRIVDICSSNFALVMKDDQGGLWAVGLGEHDRNMAVTPLPVQKAIEGQLESDDQGSAPVVMNEHVTMKKAYNRVVLLDGNDDNHPGLTEYDTKHRAFEVVIHQGEAFLQVVEVLENDAMNEGKTLVDYTMGWQHQLAIFQE